MARKPKALVLGVGAERGIGGAVSRRYAKEGHHLLVAGRTAAKIDKVPKDVDPIKLIMAANGVLLLNGKKTSPAELPDRLKAIHAQNADRQLLLNTDAKVPYVKVREMLALLQNLGFKGVSLKVQPKREGG